MVAKLALHEFAKTFGKKFEGRHKYVGASEVGACARKIWYLKHQEDEIAGVPPDIDFEESLGAAHRGTVFEDFYWIPALRAKYGNKLLYTGTDQKRFQIGKLSGAADGLLIEQPRDALAHLFVPDIGPSREILLDAKSADPRSLSNLTEPHAIHVFQMHTNLGLMREVGPHAPDYGVISYTNASFYDNTLEFSVKFDPEIYAEAKKRSNLIMIASAPSELAPEGVIEGSDECKYCPFENPCRKLRADVPKDEGKNVDPQFLAEMVDLAREEKRWSTIASDAEVEKRNIQYQLKEKLRSKGLRTVEGAGIKIIWSMVKGRTSLDVSAVREALIQAGFEIADFEKVSEASDRLTISVSAQTAKATGKSKS